MIEIASQTLCHILIPQVSNSWREKLGSTSAAHPGEEKAGEEKAVEEKAGEEKAGEEKAGGEKDKSTEAEESEKPKEEDKQKRVACQVKQ